MNYWTWQSKQKFNFRFNNLASVCLNFIRNKSDENQTFQTLQNVQWMEEEEKHCSTLTFHFLPKHFFSTSCIKNEERKEKKLHFPKGHGNKKYVSTRNEGKKK